MSSHNSLLHLLSQSRSKKNRRSHKKSRNGCTECKRRHIRCDERRPACANCAVAELTCSFPKPSSTSAPTPTPTPTDTGGARADSGSENGTRTPPPPPIPPPPSSPVATFTSSHIKLLHHLETKGSQLFMSHDAPDTCAVIVDTAVRFIDDAPYLMDELLAVAAVHLAAANGDSSLAQLATELQTRAISAFTQSLALPSDADAVPKFLFAATLSIHDLADTLVFVRQPAEPLASVVDRLVRCFKLHQGMRSAVIHPVWDRLVASDLGPLITRGRSRKPPDDAMLFASPFRPSQAASAATAPSHPDFAALDALEGAVKSSSAATSDALAALRWSFQDCHRSREYCTRAVSAFCTTLPPDFNALLLDMVPEALAVAAYFALLIHRSSSAGWWVFGDGVAAALVAKVAAHLGQSWSGLMAWPLEAIHESPDGNKPLQQG